MWHSGGMRRSLGTARERSAYVSDATRFAVCPHCWGVNPHADRLCGRCGADMHTVLQESGGLRATAPVQSPVPVRAGNRLSLLQRVLVFAFVLTLFAAQVLAAVLADRRPASRLPSAIPAAAP